jgi:hypothetical protein
MRDSDWASGSAEKEETAIIRRVRSMRRLRIESGDRICFNAAAFRVDRDLGVAEHLAVENNITIIRRWPEIIAE